MTGPNSTLCLTTRLRACLLMLTTLVFFPGPLRAQQAGLQIVSPLAGTTVAPATPFAVAVVVPPGTTISQVFVLAQNIGFSDIKSAPPYSFNLTSPDSGLAGPLNLTAIGIDSSGNVLFSPSVTIAVEPTAPISTLSISPAQIGFSFAGQQVPLIVIGTFQDGTVVDLAQSPRIAYSSSNPSVALVSNDGIVTSVGSGTSTSTQIVIKYGNQTQAVPVTVPHSSRGDLNGDGRVDIDDLNIILSALGTQATLPVDARDLDNDGKIDEQDAQILMTLCSLPGCGTSPSQTVPTITWPTPVPIIYGTALSGTQLNASTSLPGVFVYTPPSNTILAAGIHTLFVSFRPTDVGHYTPAVATTSLKVTYGTCLLYDPTRAVQSGSTLPLKIQLCDSNNTDVSSSNVVVHAVSLVQTSTNASEVLQASGNANPGNNFRFDPTLGPSGGYIFNLNTKGLTTGSYQLTFTAAGDPLPHVLSFQVM